MKLSDFYDKNTEFKPQLTQVLAFNNETKEAELESKIASLEQKTAQMEQLATEKGIMSGQLEIQQQETQSLLQKSADLELQVSNLEAQVTEKERFLGDLESFKQQNSSLLLNHGEMMTRMNELRFDSDRMHEELEQLRTNNGGLEVARQSLSNELLNKEVLIKEITTAISELQTQHEGLRNTSDTLAKEYTELADTNQTLGRSNSQLNIQIEKFKKQQQIDEESYKTEKNLSNTAIEKSVRGSMNGRIEELQQDVDDLMKMNKYYKSELSKPQHMSVGAIARQENFKIPLASNAINYRTNNLGTAQPTLLKFSSREAINDN